MTTVIPNSISELELFIRAAHTEGLRQLFIADELPFSTYHDEFENLESKAYELDDPILKLLITKKTKQTKILELSLTDKNRAIRNAALQNASIVNDWSEDLLVPETLASLGLLKFIDSLNAEEKRTFLFENTALRSTRALTKLLEIYLSADTDLESKCWLAATLSTRLPDYAFEDPFSGSYEPPLEDWKREQMMAEVLASILTAPKDLLFDLIAPH